MRLILILFCAIVYLGPMTGCDENTSVPTTRIEVDTEPVGVGLGVIGGGIVIAAWVMSVMSGGGKHED